MITYIYICMCVYASLSFSPSPSQGSSRAEGDVMLFLYLNNCIFVYSCTAMLYAYLHIFTILIDYESIWDTHQAQGSSHSSRNNFQAKAFTEQGSWKAPGKWWKMCSVLLKQWSCVGCVLVKFGMCLIDRQTRVIRALPSLVFVQSGLSNPLNPWVILD